MTQYAYDATGSLAKETDANGHSTNYVNNQLEKVTKSDGKTISCTIFRNFSTLVEYAFSTEFQFIAE